MSTPLWSLGMVYPVEKFVSYLKFSKLYLAFLASLDFDNEPRNYSEAIKDDCWWEAMSNEIKALEENGTWTIQNLPEAKWPIRCKWVYKIKWWEYCSIERYKACFVAKGYTQVEGMDFHETFAPVAKMTNGRHLLCVALAWRWELHQMDVYNAFLYGDLDEEVYMRLSLGYHSHGNNKVCRLQISLYGLKQVSQNWFAKFAGASQGYVFTQSLANYHWLLTRKVVIS